MSAKAEITQKLMKVYDPADVRAGQVFKGFAYDGHRETDGWWYQPFNGQPIWLGKSKAEALEAVDDIADSRE